MKFIKLFIFLTFFICNNLVMADDYLGQLNECMMEKSVNDNQITDNAMLWYKTSIEKYAIFKQTLDNAYEQINKNIKTNKIVPNSWGIIISLDNTILDTSNYKIAQSKGCVAQNGSDYLEYIQNVSLPSLPDTADFTCSVQALGGKVFVVTNRDASEENGSSIINATESNLAEEKICYDSIAFANGFSDRNKNPRFNAISSGDYENIIITAKYSIPLNIIAYVGNDIEDFPNLQQSMLNNKREIESDLDKFGSEYFILPNPISGSWHNNNWK